MDVAKLIIHQARSREPEPAVVFTGGVATYGILVRAVASAADRLAQADLTQGAIVAVDVRNPFHHLALILALELRGIAGNDFGAQAAIRCFADLQLEVRPALVDKAFRQNCEPHAALIDSYGVLLNCGICQLKCARAAPAGCACSTEDEQRQQQSCEAQARCAV